MNPRPISPELSVSPQLTLDDVSLAAAAGIRTILCNRPDGEGDQIPSAAIQAAAEAHGLAFAYIPAASGAVSDEAARDFAEALATLPAPILAYCRSGTRSATLWALAMAETAPTDAILAATAGAGYDLTSLRGRLEARAAPTEGDAA